MLQKPDNRRLLMSTSLQGSLMIDAATLGTAAAQLERETNAPLQSNGSPAQDQFVRWLNENRKALGGLHDMQVQASDDHNVLNQFLVGAGYDALFGPIPAGCHGVAAILDMIVKWKYGAAVTTVKSMTGTGQQTFEAFCIPIEGARVFELEDRPDILVQLLTEDGSSVWLTKAPRPHTELDLLDFATRTMNTQRVSHLHRYTEIVVPKVSIKHTVSLEWLIGASYGSQSVEQAFQIVSVDIDETGGHVKSMAGMATTESMMDSHPLVFDRPFILWFTQGDNQLPIASTYVDYDAWKSQG